MFGQKMLSERKGLLLQIEWNTGATGIGEIAPLPGWSRESLKDVLRLMPALMRDLQGHNVTDLLFGKREDSILFGLPPSIVFGVETALLSTPAARRNNPLFISGETVDLTINGLLNFNRQFDLDADASIAKRFEIIKVKAPFTDPDLALSYLRGIRDANPGLQLLLDANQGWDLKALTPYLPELRELDIFYVEEPFASITESEAFFKAAGIHYALDEQWISNSAEILKKIEQKQLPGLRAIVVKPTLFGSIIKLENIASRLAFHGIQLVISSCFESGVGISTLSRLAYNLSPGSFAGLDTIKSFKSDLLNPPLHLANNAITVYPLVSQPFSLVEAFYTPINPKILEQYIESNRP